MIKSKKLSIFIFSLVLVIASFLFVACGKLDYSNTYLSSSCGEYLELFVNEEQEVSITIERPVDKMNKGLRFTSSNQQVVQIQRVASQNNTTTYSVKGLSGGRTTVEFVTIEGVKTFNLTIFVKEYSDKLVKGENGLYVSDTTALEPASSDFTFKESSTERELEYYFYGQNKVEGSLTIEDIKENDLYVNNFTRVQVYNLNDNAYLIFTDKDGLLHTLGRSQIVDESENVRYEFIDVTNEEGEFSFNEEIASSVNPGMKFTFVAKYEASSVEQIGEKEIIICEREFSFISDINPNNFSHEYGFKISERDFVPGLENTSYKIDELKSGKITLIPNYSAAIKDNPLLVGYTANFLTAYLEVTVKTNELLNLKAKTRNNNIANSKILNTLKSGENTIYYIEVNCGSGSANSTFFDLNFYYDGFENSEDQNVNYTFSVPIEIRIIPTNLLINNVNFTQNNKVYNFYNNYASDDSGWQAFNFSVIPEGAEYDNLVLDLTGTNLQIKYLNNIYVNRPVQITNLREPVYIKGGENAEVTSEVASLPVKMDFNVIQEDSLETNIKYQILKGATALKFENEEFRENIYLERFSGEKTFSNIYSDAQFSSMSFALESGKDVVRFNYDENDMFNLIDGKYYLNIKMLPIDNGSGTYTITLDNGTRTTFTINVREALNSLTVQSSNEDNSIRLKEDGENQSLIYLINKNGRSYFDLRVIANGKNNSTAINSIDVLIESSNISMKLEENGNYLFYSSHNGSDEIKISVQGYIIENFVCDTISIDYIINLVTYDLAEGIRVNKLRDGFVEEYEENVSANYINVYSNTYFDKLRQAEIEVTLKNDQAYLFQNPENNNFIPSRFLKEFIYFESESALLRNGVYVNKMYYSPNQSNVYTIGSYGTFDTEKMVFTAFDNLTNGARITLVAHVMQYGQIYSFTINININVYNEVDRISLQSPVTEFEFSVLKPEQSVIAFPTNNDATNAELRAIVSGATIVDENNKEYQMIDKDSISYVVSDGKTQISFKVNDEFIRFAESFTETIEGEILIVASDWLDGNGNLRSGYNEKAISIKTVFANGSEKLRFTINNVDDLLLIKNNLSAHYRLKTSIDVSSILNELPLGELSGSIIGVTDFASITGISIANNTNLTIEGEKYFGLFSKIAQGAYIEYIKFEGNFDLNIEETSYIGLVAGENNGSLINVGTVINKSNVNIIVEGNCYLGGIVGVNNGEIIQDFTLFEADNSATRSLSPAQLSQHGRLSYSGLAPHITLFMNDYLDVSYNVYVTRATRSIGSVAGINKGIIRKVDSKVISLSGQLNYMAYSLIRTNYSTTLPSVTNLNSYVGGIAGESEIVVNSATRETGGLIVGGFNNANGDFNAYANYKTEYLDGFVAGNGMIVGGEINGYGYLGGVVGRFTGITDRNQFTGITTRTFIRGKQAGVRAANIALVANIEQATGNGLNSSFAIQAVDDGKVNEESAMLVLYASELPNGYESNGVLDYNRLGFGNFSHGVTCLSINNTIDSVANVYSYISRDYVDITKDSPIISNASRTIYYGDFVVVGQTGNQNQITYQAKFAKGNVQDLSIDANFANKLNKMHAEANDMYYAYFFEVGSISDENGDVAELQNLINRDLNNLSMTSGLYPFKAYGEMIFTSKSTDILSIDYDGKMTIKKTGLALVSASSILNSNNALNFYIYVVNYFDTEGLIENNDDRTSIIYPTSASSSVAVDDATIELRGNNSATLYVLPKYNFVSDENGLNSFVSNSRGEASYGGMAFNLASNTDVSANVEVVGDNGELLEGQLDISIVGQTITIKRLASTSEGVYKLRITPRLERTVGEEIYFASVNKTIYDTKVDYKYGALDIFNTNYNNVPIYTSKGVEEQITILTTDQSEDIPKYYIVGLDDKLLQGDDINKNEYQFAKNEGLFKVDIKKNGEIESLGNGMFNCKFIVKITINTNSSLYLNRYEKNIYGRYLLFIQSASNSAKSLMIELDFEKTGITSIVIDNYTVLDEITSDSGLTSTSDLAYPGKSGLLAFTINPSDSDFDYILIENDDANYNSGRASANFVFLSRNKGYEDKQLFDDSKISGSIVTKGLKITQEELISAYSDEKYVDYNGNVYIKYDFSSNNVVDLSKSKIIISVYKDGEVVYSASKELTIKLQNFVSVEIDGKEGIANQAGAYMTYEVARGMSYKLNINSYGFRQDNINIVSSNPSYGRIINDNGTYYLNITEGNINYQDGANEIEIISSASQQDGESVRTAESRTKVIIYEYVINYNENVVNPDIVKGMGNGVINMQVGTRTTFELDLYQFIEYNPSISGVVNKIEEFMASLERVGSWTAYTNLISDNQPDYKMAGSTSEPRLSYNLGYENGNEIENNNYYFNSTGLRLTPKRTHIPEEKFYYFTYEGYYAAESGMYGARENSNGGINRRVSTTFVLSVYSSSSEESPIPIYSYSDFINMQEGGYYILLNDITLPSVDDEGEGVKAFTPLNGNFASLDGNEHAINFAGVYDMGDLSEIGLFSSLNDGSIIKNLIVNYTSSSDGSDFNNNPDDAIYGLYGLRTVKFVTTSDNFVFGSIVAQNSGIITNCQVYTDTVENNEYYLTIRADNALTGNSLAGGLVGYNNGYITNCGVSINAKMPYNIAGLVAQNNKNIAACYFEKGKIINNSNYDQHSAGLVLTNTIDGKIITSYVSGAQSRAQVYSHDTDSYISSTFASGGFIYDNRGYIKDCYTDIYLARTSSDMAGFAYKNGGTIKNCFSLSILRSGTTASAGFARDGVSESRNGTFENCYYLYDLTNGINVSLYNVAYEGVERITEEDFGNIDEFFKDYSYDENISTKSVWFFSQGFLTNDYVEYVPTTEKVVLPNEEGGVSQSNTIFKTELLEFGKNRLSLVAPNVRTLSVRNFSHSDIDEATGNVTYNYIDDDNAPDRGTIHNPRLIHNSQTMEDEILNQTALNNLNVTDYRIISDISYIDFPTHSSLYRVIYAGNMEGNGMEISGIGLVYMSSRTNGGLFSQIGYSANQIGSVKNLTIAPKEVIFNNTNNVGVLAGILNYGYIYDITVDAHEHNLEAVSGLNFVGGIIGRATTEFEAKDIYSNVNVWSVYSPIDDNTYVENSGMVSSYSYAGGLIGYVGSGRVYNAHADGITSVTGSRTGFVFGGIGSGGDVQYSFVNVTSGAKLRANHFAGYIVGENAGSMKYSYVSDNGNVESSFVNIPKAAQGVGGIAGKLTGGSISNAYVGQSFRATNSENEPAIGYVGGIVGVVEARGVVSSQIEESVVDCDISASTNIGGAVGYVSSQLKLGEVTVKSSKLSISGMYAGAKLGGIVGEVANSVSAVVEMNNCYSLADLEIDTYTIGVVSEVNVGGLVGYTGGANRLKLSYCYTTSSVTAKVYDARALDAVGDFASMKNNLTTFAYAQITEGIEEFDHVYYLGTNQYGEMKGDDENTVYTNNKNFVSFSTKAKNVQISLRVNNYGKSSFEYVNDDLKENNLSSGIYSTLRSFNNLFGNYYQVGDEAIKDDEGNVIDSYLYNEFIYNPISNLIVLNAEIQKIYNGDANNKDLFVRKDAENTEQLFKSKCHQNILYKGSDGQYYLSRINEDGIGYYRLSDKVMINKNLLNVSLKSVWITSESALSSLEIENSFDWFKNT